MRYHALFKIEAKGVTPLPAPTSTAISYLNTSSEALPNGPSMNNGGRMRLSVGSMSGPLLSEFTPTTADPAFPFLSGLRSKLQPTA